MDRQTQITKLTNKEKGKQETKKGKQRKTNNQARKDRQKDKQTRRHAKTENKWYKQKNILSNSNTILSITSQSNIKNQKSKSKRVYVDKMEIQYMWRSARTKLPSRSSKKFSAPELEG